jgi:hypothetical protein
VPTSVVGVSSNVRPHNQASWRLQRQSLSHQAMSKAQDIQYMVLWSIGGPFALVLALFLLSAVFFSVATPSSDSWAVGAGAVLHYCARFRTVVVAPVAAAFGLLGLVKLRNAEVKHKALTLSVCATALAMPAALVGALYFGRTW